jgi:superfamily II RNA helicase
MTDNKAILIGYYGGDKTHSLAAWSSTFLELDLEIPLDIEDRVDVIIDYILSNSKRIRNIEQLLLYLAQENHTSPFRFSTLHFVTTTEIATHIQFLKHSVALSAENAESARYKELQEDKFYLPSDWLEYGKTGEYWYNMLKSQSQILNEIYHTCLDELVKAGMPKARAKESARFFKMYNSQINSNKMMSFDGFVQIYKKRNLLSPSQKEIADVVEQMLDEIKSIPNNPFEYSLKSFNL